MCVWVWVSTCVRAWVQQVKMWVGAGVGLGVEYGCGNVCVCVFPNICMSVSMCAGHGELQ